MYTVGDQLGYFYSHEETAKNEFIMIDIRFVKYRYINRWSIYQ